MQLVLQFFILLSLICQSSCSFLTSAVECKTGSQDPSKVARTITVSKSGSGNFATIADALNSIPSGNDQWIKISLDPGTYKEQNQIPVEKQCIILEGRDRSTTKIVFDAHSSTAESPTLAVFGHNFVAKGITFMNSYNLPLGGNQNPQLQAIALAARGDKQAFFSCGFEGYIDTLWDENGRHYFHSCYIEGAIDFIWGSGQSIYEQCAINFTAPGCLTAQGRESRNDTNGFVFRQCDISGNGRGWLGRPYKGYARVIFHDSKFNYRVDPQGYDIWHQHGHEGDITFAEVNCTGIGADTSKRVPWLKKNLSDSEIQSFTTKAFIDQEGWIAKLPISSTQNDFTTKKVTREGRFFKDFYLPS